ncbi:hypothetical protein ACVIIW_000836 [Bradyrhizobium sp. USDA 4449]
MSLLTEARRKQQREITAAINYCLISFCNLLSVLG